MSIEIRIRPIAESEAVSRETFLTANMEFVVLEFREVTKFHDPVPRQIASEWQPVKISDD